MKLIHLLGYAGLLPFIALPLLYNQQWMFDSAELLQLYQLYSALILGFMAGVLWPVLYQQQHTACGRHLALLAVCFPVLSIIGLAFASAHFLLLQALLFVLLRLAEYGSQINRQYSTDYCHLRNQLTLVVSASHLLMYWCVSSPLSNL